MRQPDFGQLRSLVHGAPSPPRWQELCASLERWPARRVREVVLPYLEAELERWPRALRLAPPRWVLRLSLEQEVPGWGIARTMRLRGLTLPGRLEALRLAQREELGCIQRLEIWGGGRNAAWFELLVAGGQLAPEELRVLDWDLSPRRLVRALKGARLERLRALQLERARLADPELEGLLELEPVRAVTRLQLAHNRLTDAAAFELARASWRALAHLDVSHNRIGARGARALQRAPGMPALQTLALRGNRIGQEASRAMIMGWM